MSKLSKYRFRQAFGAQGDFDKHATNFEDNEMLQNISTLSNSKPFHPNSLPLLKISNGITFVVPIFHPRGPEKKQIKQ